MADEQIGSMVVELRADADKFISAFRGAETVAIGSVGGIKNALGTLGGVAGVAATATVGALTTIGTVSVREFSKFDDAMTRSLANMAKVSITMEQEMSRAARRLAMEQGAAADETAKAYLVMSKAGFTAEQSIASLNTVESFAEVTGLNMMQSARSLGDSMKVLGLNVGTTTERVAALTNIADTFVRAGQLGSQSAEELAGVLSGRMGASLRSLGFGLNESVAALILFDRAGMSGMRGTMSLIGLMEELKTSAISNKNVWREYGVSVLDAQGKLLPLQQLLPTLNGIFGNLDDEQKKVAQSLFGLSENSVRAIGAVGGMSSQLQGLQTELRNVNGLTTDTANKFDREFSEQFDRLWATLKDMAIEIGANVAPMIKDLNEILLEASKDTGAWKENLATVANVIKTGVVVAISVVSDAIYGWQILIAAGKVGFGGLFGLIITWSAKAAEALQGNINKIIEAYNWMVRLRNSAIDFAGLPKGLKDQEVGYTQFANTLSGLAADAQLAVEQSLAELQKLAEGGRPSERLTAALLGTGKAITAVGVASTNTATEVKTSTAQIVSAVGTVSTAYTRLSPEVVQLRQSIRYAWEEGLETLKRYDKMLADGALTYAEYTRAVAALNLKGELTDPFESAMQKIPEWEAMLKNNLISVTEYRDKINETLNSLNPVLFGVETHPGSASGFGGKKDEGLGGFGDMGTNATTGISGVDEINRLQDQEKQLTKSYKKQHDIITKSTFETEAERLRILRTMETNYRAQMETYNTQRTKLMMSGMSDAFGQMAEAMGQASGKQSGIYKAMFIASKAFAIADATVSISQGIAKAASLGWPAMIPAIAAVIASTASIISNISAVTMSFEGGGDTPKGARVGGLDGRGGMLAMVHPNERIIDFEKPSENNITNNGPSTNVTIQQTFTGGVTEKDLARASAQNKRETMQAVVDGISRGGAYRDAMRR